MTKKEKSLKKRHDKKKNMYQVEKMYTESFWWMHIN